jgi:hypothetical protein
LVIAHHARPWALLIDLFVHERCEVTESLREERLPCSNEIADDSHATHKRAFNDQQRPAKFYTSFLNVFNDELISTVD